MRIITLLLFFILDIKAQVKVTDSITNKGIPFVAIIFGDGNGLYTDENGIFDIKNIINDTIHLSSIGYKSKMVQTKSYLDKKIIYLTPSSERLEEVVLKNNKKKGKLKKVKAKRHDNFLESYNTTVGEETACYIPNEYKSFDIKLAKVIFPVVTKTMSYEVGSKVQTLKKHPFSTMFKVSFYNNNDGKPGKQFIYEDIRIIINEKSNFVKLDLKNYNIFLPDEGFFIGIQNLGKTNKNNELLPTKYTMVKTNKGIVKVSGPIRPYFPVNHKINETHTFSRSIFNKNHKWKPFFKYGQVRKGEFHNISLGYELIVY